MSFRHFIRLIVITTLLFYSKDIHFYKQTLPVRTDKNDFKLDSFSYTIVSMNELWNKCFAWWTL